MMSGFGGYSHCTESVLLLHDLRYVFDIVSIKQRLEVVFQQ
jgi:hypothetical protein